MRIIMAKAKKPTKKTKKASNKYSTSDEFRKGFMELRSACLEWAIRCAKEQEESGFKGALMGLGTATTEFMRQTEIDAIREEGRATRQGFILEFQPDQPEAEA
jgi:hypothetical protein